MSLPTVRDLKAYARIEHDNEDDLLRLILRRARAEVESFLGKPIDATPSEFYDDGKTGRWDEAPKSLILPMLPFNPATLVVRDRDETVVPASTYYVDSATGIITGKTGEFFPLGPYRLSVTVGMATASTYATRDEALLGQCILDLAMVYYQQRSPNTSTESAGGASVTYGATAFPPRTRAALEQLRGFVLAP